MQRWGCQVPTSFEFLATVGPNTSKWDNCPENSKTLEHRRLLKVPSSDDFRIVGNFCAISFKIIRFPENSKRCDT